MTDLEILQKLIFDVLEGQLKVTGVIKELKTSEKALTKYLKACNVELPSVPRLHKGRRKSNLHPTDCVCLNSMCKKVKCVETGVIYDSVRQAGRMVGVAAPCISSCLNHKHKTSAGYHWETVEKTS